MAKILKVYRKEGEIVLEETFLVSLKKVERGEFHGKEAVRYSRILVESKECSDPEMREMFLCLTKCPKRKIADDWLATIPYYLRPESGEPVFAKVRFLRGARDE